MKLSFKTHKFYLRTLNSVFLCSLLSCSSPSLLNMVQKASTYSQSARIGGLEVGSRASVSGSLPMADVGTLWRSNDLKTYSRNVAVSEGQSYILRAENVYTGDMKALQKAVLKFQNSMSNRVAARYNVALAEARQYVIAQKDNKDYLPVVDTAASLADDAKLQYQEALANFDKDLDALVDQLKEPGVMVMSWEQAKGFSGGLIAKNLLKLVYAQKSEQGGLIIVTGLRQSILHVGPDILRLHNHLHWREKENMKVITTTLQANNLFYIKKLNISKLLAADGAWSFKGSDLKKALKAAEIEMKLVQASVSSLTGVGTHSKPTRNVEPLTWDDYSNVSRQATSNWLTFYSTEASLASLQKMVSRRYKRPAKKNIRR